MSSLRPVTRSLGGPSPSRPSPRALHNNPDLLERFHREAKSAGLLQHPNIVTIYELSESDGSPFIAMEYLEGESLEQVIACRLPLPLAQKLGYIVQACRAFDYAHQPRRGSS